MAGGSEKGTYRRILGEYRIGTWQSKDVSNPKLKRCGGYPNKQSGSIARACRLLRLEAGLMGVAASICEEKYCVNYGPNSVLRPYVRLPL